MTRTNRERITFFLVVAWRRSVEHSWYVALVAQWIEHQTSNLGVAGSSPARGSVFWPARRVATV